MSDRNKFRKDPQNRQALKLGSTHCFHCGAKLPDPELPTNSAPGTNEKIRVMRARADRGLPTHNVGDFNS